VFSPQKDLPFADGTWGRDRFATRGEIEAIVETLTLDVDEIAANAE